MQEQKAEDFYSIQDAVSINTPIDSSHPFYTDFTPYRTNFTEKKIFKHLNINPKNGECNPLKSPKKIFLSGYRGTGKTSELLTLQKRIEETECYMTIFVDIAQEELDTSNIETVDILILMLEKLIATLDERGADISGKTITDFSQWYKSKIIETVNKKLEGSAQIEVGIDTKGTLFANFLGLLSNTKAKLKGSHESKTEIRREINNNFSMFSNKFNEFILSLARQLREKEKYQDILFIVDGFEKIGSLEDRKKVLVDDANKLTIIKSHMIVTLPIELFTEKNRLNHFATTENFPLVDIESDEAKECFKEFILKRIDKNLIEDNAIERLIEFGAGHPRQTLQIISRAFIEAEEEILDLNSIEKAIEVLGAEMSKVDDKEIELLKSLDTGKTPTENDIYTTLKAKNIIFEYGSGASSSRINPMVREDKDFQKLLEG